MVLELLVSWEDGPVKSGNDRLILQMFHNIYLGVDKNQVHLQ